mmetsp:Transcript_80363/g.215459  ORF Transcript_80363/g.215459 Transcript_80363/m.215459 type:complete len:281 (+) Transcript_80363:503-1345(+)
MGGIDAAASSALPKPSCTMAGSPSPSPRSTSTASCGPTLRRSSSMEGVDRNSSTSARKFSRSSGESKPQARSLLTNAAACGLACRAASSAASMASEPNTERRHRFIAPGTSLSRPTINSREEMRVARAPWKSCVSILRSMLRTAGTKATASRALLKASWTIAGSSAPKRRKTSMTTELSTSWRMASMATTALPAVAEKASSTSSTASRKTSRSSGVSNAQFRRRPTNAAACGLACCAASKADMMAGDANTERRHRFIAPGTSLSKPRISSREEMKVARAP